jgi:hypothetical protein
MDTAGFLIYQLSEPKQPVITVIVPEMQLCLTVCMTECWSVENEGHVDHHFRNIFEQRV